MRYLIFLFAVLVVPLSADASDPLHTRQQGFSRIWETVKRPATEVGERPYTDVPADYPGYLELTYAKARGLLDDTVKFEPDDILLRDDAVLWLFRTRNVASLDQMNKEDLPALLAKYPITTMGEIDNRSAGILWLDDTIEALDKMLAEEEHEISFYAEYFQGAGTAFGEKFDMYEITAAHRTFPYNTLVRVTNMDTGKSVVVRINDRGPYVHGRDMDLSHAAFEKIAEHSNGIVRRAQFERLGDINLVEGAVGISETSVVCATAPARRYQRRITRDVRFNRGVPHTLTLGETMTLGSTKFFVVRWIEKPDGSRERAENWIDEDEKYHFTPSYTGMYRFRVGTGFGSSRVMRTKVSVCGE